jgi:membrane-associated phospholipid phosphatase
MAEIWPGVLLTAYLAVTGARITLGVGHANSFVLAAHFAFLAAALASLLAPGVPQWLADWLPMLAVPFLYAELPVVIEAVGHAGSFDAAVAHWDVALFGGAPSTDWARARPSTLLSETLHAAYAAYYPVVLSVPVLLYVHRRRRDYSEAVFVILLSFIACFLVFSVFPVEGPRYRGVQPMPGAIRAGVLWLLERGSARGTAFPSSHVAVAVAQSILATRYFGWRGALLWIPTVGLGAGAVYGGFHYAVDVFSGLVFGVVITTIGLMAVRRARQAHESQANATAPM